MLFALVLQMETGGGVRMQGIGKYIRKYREDAGITQEKLAEMLDMSTNHLGAIERDVKSPTLNNFVKLLNIIGAEPNEVLQEVVPVPRKEHLSRLEEKIENLTPKQQEKVFHILEVVIEEILK